jgi:hypothetical protein
MTARQIELVIDLIEARISEHRAEDSSDGGLHEGLVIMDIEKELRATAKEDAATYSS